tara:strand:- start:379 stop:867 length:489 start_codon:yes stop_codon:yes gene_type:complete
MPCTKCKDGKYKWGKTGECKYDSKEACEKANPKNYNKMKPTPLGKTYEEYAKELKEYNLSKVEKIELALVDDLKKVVVNALDFRDQAVNSYNIVRKEADNAISDSKSGEKWLSKVIDEYKKVQKAANELGVKVPNEIQGLYDSAVKAGADFREILKATSSIK